MALSPVVAGVAEHNGWAVLVCVGVKGGSPEVVDRRRVELVEPGLPNQPYEHETVGMNSTEAERLVQEVRESAAHCAERALSRLKSTHELVSIALRTAPLPKRPASVAEVHASWYLRARADAMLYHDALCTAAATLGIGVAMFPKGKERPQAAEAMASTSEALDAFLSGFRATLGPPWQQDHQAATARAIATLGRYTSLQLHNPQKS
jgi:hypothetical protein